MQANGTGNVAAETNKNNGLPVPVPPPPLMEKINVTSTTTSGNGNGNGNSSAPSSGASSMMMMTAHPSDQNAASNASLLRPNDEMPPTLEVLRKYDDVEHRRRSATLRVDSAGGSSNSRGVSSFDRARHSGVNRLLRSNSSSHHHISSNNDSSSSSQFHSATSGSDEPRSLGSEHHQWTSSNSHSKSHSKSHSNSHSSSFQDQDSLKWTNIVLKMTSFSDDDLVTSFRFTEDGGTIGRAETNTAAIPADKLLAQTDHARVLYRHGRFYISPGAGPGAQGSSTSSTSSATNSGTFIRLSGCGATVAAAKDEDKMQWPLDLDAVFRAGKCDFYVTKCDLNTQILELSAKSGKLAGQVYSIGSEGAGIGRSAENLIHAGDGELSRKHCAVWFDLLTCRFYLLDLNSTNGTFMKLTGPYKDPYRLEIGDDLLISQTCLTVNRFDYGAHANMGARKHMEDAHTILQDLQIAPLASVGLTPQSFFAVYDGHGGMEASSYLSEMLHHNIQAEFRTQRNQFVDPEEQEPLDEQLLYTRIEDCLTMAFQRTDDDFLVESERPQAGSTATTVFIAGNQLFVANVGDSRTVLSSKGGQAVRLSNDHKPNRPDEAQRIRDTGGFVIHGRIMGELAVSRAFGDSPFKTFELPESPKPKSSEGAEGLGSGSSQSKPRSEYDSQELPVNPNEILKGPLVIATPEITRTELTGDEEFVVLASDGLYDVLKDQEVVDYVRRKIVELGDVQRAVEATVEHAIVHQRSMDNVTAVVVLFQEPRQIALTMAAAKASALAASSSSLAAAAAAYSTGSTSSVTVATPPVTITSLLPPPSPSTAVARQS